MRRRWIGWIGWMGLIFLLRCVDGHLIVANLTIPIIQWNQVTPDHPLLPLHAHLYKDSLYNSSEHWNESCIILYDGPLSSNYHIATQFEQTLAKYLPNPFILGILTMDSTTTPGWSSFGVPKPALTTFPIWLAGKQSTFLSTIDEKGIPVTIAGRDQNEWVVVDAAFNFWVWSLVVGHLACIVTACYTLFLLHRKGRTLSIASLCLVLELCGSIIRILAVLLEWYLMLYNTRFLSTLTMPFFLGSSGLLVFFWLDITSGSLYDGKFLDQMKIPAIIFFLILCSVEIILDILDYFDMVYNIYFMMSYIVLCLVLGVLYFVVAQKISKLLHNLTRKKATLKRINLRARICAFLFFCFALLIILLATPGCSDYVVSYRTVLYLVYLVMTVISLLQISIFHPGTHRSNSTHSEIQNKRKSTQSELQNHKVIEN